LDITNYPGARPELALWRCPECGAEESLTFNERRWLDCGECGARWDARGGDLTRVLPEEGAGERDTLAGWVRRSPEPRVPGGAGARIATASCQLKEDPQADVTLRPLASLGGGHASLFSDRLEWKGKGRERRVLLTEIRSVTTERNDILQLGIGDGVVQLVFDRSSPWRWQWHLKKLHNER